MSTLIQLFKKFRLKKKHHKIAPALKNCPQVRGVVKKPRIVTPRKPNSARRPVAKVVLSNKKRVTSHLPGVGHNIRPHSAVLIRGGGARDLPGVGYTCIRGVLDFSNLPNKKRKRSIFGVKKPIIGVKKLRRRFRFK